MRSEFLPFSPPLIGDEEIAEVIDTLRSDWITTGPKVSRFEREFAEYVGASAALGLNSCTAALHVALATLGIGPGDEVITTPMTFCSTVNVIEQVGATPVLVDVDPNTLLIDPEEVARAARRCNKNGNLKAIIPVHLYGQPCDMDALLAIAAEHKAAIIEDAAHALPTKYKGKMIGASSGNHGVPVLTCFSFYATKNLCTAEGGMLCGPANLIDEARIWSLHGLSRDAWKRYDAGGSWFYEVLCPGFKYNMTDIQAAIGIHQLKKLNSFHKRRKEIAQVYTERLSKCGKFLLPVEQPGTEHAWHLYPIRLKESAAISRDEFIKQLNANNIGSSVHFIPVHLHPYYQNKFSYEPLDFPVAYREYQKLISLPLFPRMSDRDVCDVLEAVSEITACAEGAHSLE